MSVTALERLSQMPEHTSVNIHAIQADVATRMRLLGMGLGKGSSIQILRNRWGDMVVGSGHNRISLGRSITHDILVSTSTQYT
ncbi:MAG: FeoA family protein [Thiofilum sp.]|uniref:FeoA family protein n=1 Tax=Thiofilum sp. TaxID=2212733 RepID=UPI0025E6D1F1|nr:FeoA family protein [Thiofilum sp.]MBK8454580.1 ferrous iron transport protein A [Thiofilum sp.]